jgi:aminoglycoside phosphotransferase (APT) family kinase protein
MLFAGEYVVKYAWSESASRLLLHQARVLTALTGLSLPVAVPMPVHVNADPALLVYRALPGNPMPWTVREAADAATVAIIGRQLGEVLGQLHASAVIHHLDEAGVSLPLPQPQSTPDALRRRLFHLLDSRRASTAEALVVSVEKVLAGPSARAFLHGDFHGHNLLLADNGLDVTGLLDFEESAAGDPCYDLRYLPALAPTLDLLSAVMEAHATRAGRPLELLRVLAWHVLTDLGDALWRTEQGVEVVDGPLSRRFDDLLARLERGGW